MVNFKLSNEIWKVFTDQHDTSVEQTKNLSPRSLSPGTQIFSLSHAHVMLISSLLTFIFFSCFQMTSKDYHPFNRLLGMRTKSTVWWCCCVVMVSVWLQCVSAGRLHKFCTNFSPASLSGKPSSPFWVKKFIKPHLWLTSPLTSFVFLFFGVYVGSLLLRGEEKGTAPVIKQVSWFQVLVFFYIYAITILPSTNPSWCGENLTYNFEICTNLLAKGYLLI